ncbi:uncharacterized protein LOC125777602 [Bactrocera dorsalis]|uniref:Uncharacterized protein LOC125777602 n=1 Tax=Bactrocera dorsalis TaxID=27457 RepID=A0ABM3JHF2_BACDO|nr:uncharacterized protein LOC125777602 [Bactrocera dorsalis]
MVHNRTDLDPAYKLGKLRQCVDQESVPMIGGLYTGGYHEVWSELKRRYDNPRLLAETHVQIFLDLPNNPPEASNTLRSIVDCVRNSFRALAVMDIPVHHWDAIAVPVLLPKLPTTTRNEWGMSLTSVSIPKLEDLLLFLERRANNITVAPQTVSTQPLFRRFASRTVKAHVGATNNTQCTTATPANVGCPQCSGNHRLIRCLQFRNMQVPERWERVRRLAVCFNCLRSGYTVRQCSSGACSFCQQGHNTLLCRRTGTRPVENIADTSVSPSSAASVTTPSSTSKINSGAAANHTSTGPQVYSCQQ